MIGDAKSAGERRFAALVLMLGAAAIGFAPILVRLSDTGPAAAGFWRLLFALPLLTVLALTTPGPKAGAWDAGLWRLGGLAGLLFAADLVCWHYGVHLTSVTNATVLTNLTPVVVAAAGWILFKERPSRGFIPALALAVAGAAVLATAQGAGGRGTDPPLGDALSLLTAVWYGGYFLAVRAARARYDAGKVMLVSSALGAGPVLVAALLLGESVIPASLWGWAACAGLGLVHVTGQGAIAWALGRLPAATASVVVIVQPVVAAGLGRLIFEEPLGPVQALGAALALTGVVLAQRAGVAVSAASTARRPSRQSG